MRLNSRVELIYMPTWPNDQGYYMRVRVAVNEKESWPFDVHESDWKEMDEGERHAYLERCASTLIQRYGDAREIRIRDDGQIVSRFGEADG